MKRILNIHHILQMVSGFVILLSTSCEHKDLCYDHSHTTKIQVIFDWKNAPDATPETMRLYLFPVDGNKPQAYEFTDYRGGSVNVPAGRYKALCVNSDTESVLYRNISSFDGFEAYAPDGVLNVKSSLAPRAEGTSGERVIKSPDRLYSGRLDNVTIEVSTKDQTVTLYPELSVCRYRVTIMNVSNLKYISADGVSGALSGMSGGLLVGRNELTSAPVTVPFGVTSDGISTLTADFLVFGQNSPVNPVKNLNDQDFINSHYVLFCTKNGVIKKTLLEQYSRPRQNGVNAITIREDDRVIEVRMTNGDNEIIIANRNGRAIRFHESAVRVMGRTATGVRGMTLDEDGQDEVVGMICIKDPETETIMVVSEQGG